MVIKLQRPGIRDTIESDLHILYWLARKAEETLPEAEAFDPESIVREFDRAISKELNFKFEANNLRRFTRIFDTCKSEDALLHMDINTCTSTYAPQNMYNGIRPSTFPHPHVGI